MTRTVDELRNDIRLSVGRFERIESTAFTKESLAAICEAVDYDVDPNHLPPKSQMRAGVLWKIGHLDDDDPSNGDRPFRKSELESLVRALEGE